MGHVANPNYNGGDFRHRNDNGPSETDPIFGGATWAHDVNTNWEQVPDENFRVRLITYSTVSFSTLIGQQILGYSYNGAAYVQVTPTSSEIKLSPTVHYTNRSLSVDFVGRLGTRLYFPADHFTIMDGDDGLSVFTAQSIAHPLPAEFESEWCLQLVDADVSPGDTIELRLFASNFTPYNFGYDFTPKITVAGGPVLSAEFAECATVGGIPSGCASMEALTGVVAPMETSFSVDSLEGDPLATVGVDLDGEFSAEPRLSAKIQLAGE